MNHYIRRFIFIFVLTLFAGAATNAQNEISVPRSSFRTADSDGFRAAFRHIKKGNKWLEYGPGANPKALEEYLLAYQYNNNCTELNYKIGSCYLASDHKASALPYLQAAQKGEGDLPKDITYKLAKAYHYNLEFDAAIELYKVYAEHLSRRERRKLSDVVNRKIEECNAGKELVKQPKRVVIKNLGDSVNSPYNDYNALLSGDSLMFLTSRRPNTAKQKPDKLNYMFDEDIYTASNKNGTWNKARYMTEEGFNTKHNDAIVWISYDGSKRYLYDGYKNNGDILVTTYKKDDWSSPSRLRRGFNTDMTESSLSMTKDEQTVYFVSNDPDDNLGGKDIYVSHKNKRGKWETPENLGPIVNTEYDEEAVWVSPDGKVLYFSSKGHNSMGGFDIFRSEIDPGDNWSRPVNLGYPINTPEDELFYRPTENDKIAYLSTKRPDTKGAYDIYQVISLGAKKDLLMDTEDQLLAYFDKPVTNLYAEMPAELRVDTSVSIQGTVFDAKRSTPIQAKIDLIDIQKSAVVATTISDSTGKYRIKLPENKNFGMEVRAKDYMFFLEVVEIPKKVPNRIFTHNMALNKVEVGAKIVLKNIYFDAGKATLTPESNTELDKVVSFLRENSDLTIEISGHTDNVGSAPINLKLSAARAKSVVNYLELSGIPTARLVAKGYGSTQPIAPNTNAVGKKLNRRVEFKILSKQ